MMSPSPAFTLLWPTAGGVQALDELATLGLDSLLVGLRCPTMQAKAHFRMALYSLSTWYKLSVWSVRLLRAQCA